MQHHLILNSFSKGGVYATRKRNRLSAEQRTEMWRRWKAGEPALLAWHRFGAEPDRIRRVGTGSHDVWPTVAIEIRERQPVHGALAVIPTDFVKTVRARVVVHRPRHLHIAHHDIRPAVAIEIGNCQRVRWPRRTRKLLRFPELPFPAIVDHVSRLFLLVDVRQIQPPV